MVRGESPAVKFSVIIPTLNEEDNVIACLEHLRRMSPDTEVIVADGGSTDGTVTKAREMGAMVCRSAKGRARQCNEGAASTSGEILVFLHADTRLPDGAFLTLERVFRDATVKLGTFQIAFEPGHWFLKLFTFLARFDPGFFRFGDQCFVVRRSFFQSLGGFPEESLFEDLAFIGKARKVTRVHRFPMTVVTSARRFQRNGVIRQQLYNVYLTLLYLLSVSPETLAHRYENRKMETAVTVFARFPESGKVKTRLGRSLGDTTAAEVYRLCAESVFEQVRRLPGRIARRVAYAEAEDGERVCYWAGAAFSCKAQIPGDLGQRLEQSFRDMFRQGAGRAIILASDVPDISAAIITEAIRALDRCDVVLGPSHDGGYYLIGMKKLHAELFKGIQWSTGEVLTQTVIRAEQLGLTVHHLPCLIDIDTADDLRRWLTSAPDGHPFKTYVAPRLATAWSPYPPPADTFDFPAMLAQHGLDVAPRTIETLWVNITRQCNQSCLHCHVDASPERTEQMSIEVMDRCLETLATCDSIRTLDITGGAPELHPHFSYFVTEARRLGKKVAARHNLTVTTDGHPHNGERKDGLPEFFAENRVEVIASLPYYTQLKTEEVRGKGVFTKSIEGIRRLNACGYGQPGSALILDLVYNHDGPFTPAERARLEAEYRAELTRYSLTFNRLVAVTNVPVNRFRRRLTQAGELDSYMRRLVDAFNPAAAEELVCRTTISVGLDGQLYDCDFNQMADLPITIKGHSASLPAMDIRALLERRIRFAAHCFGCTAGGGSG